MKGWFGVLAAAWLSNSCIFSSGIRTDRKQYVTSEHDGKRFEAVIHKLSQPRHTDTDPPDCIKTTVPEATRGRPLLFYFA